MHRAVASVGPTIIAASGMILLGMCIAGGKDSGPNERLFTVIIRGLGQRRYWHFKACIQQDNSGAPFLYIRLPDECAQNALFALGHVVMTPGATGLGVDFAPYLARHAQGDWGEVSTPSKAAE